MRVFLVWKRRCADVRAGTQAPPLRFRLDGLRVNVEWHLGRLRVDGWFRLGGLCVNGCGGIKPVGLVLLSAQGCRR